MEKIGRVAEADSLSAVKQVNWPFVQLRLGEDSLLHQLEEELAHVVPCDLTALQGRLHPDAHKDVKLEAQVKLVHTLDSLLQNTEKYGQNELCWKLNFNFLAIAKH